MISIDTLILFGCHQRYVCGFYRIWALWELVELFQGCHFCLTLTTPIHFTLMNVVLNSHAIGEH